MVRPRGLVVQRARWGQVSQWAPTRACWRRRRCWAAWARRARRARCWGSARRRRRRWGRSCARSRGATPASSTKRPARCSGGRGPPAAAPGPPRWPSTWTRRSARCPARPNKAPPTGTLSSSAITPWWRSAPQPARCCTAACAAGSSQRGNAHFIAEAVARARRAGAEGELCVRADSGFFSYDLLRHLDRLGVRWSVAVPQYAHVKAAIAKIPEADWAPIDYTAGGEAQVAETTLVAGRRGDERRLRLVVRRPRRTLGALAPPRLRH